MTSQGGEPTLADVQRQFPRWHCWRGISGLCYARPIHTPSRQAAPVEGEDPLDLRDQICRAESRTGL